MGYPVFREAHVIVIYNDILYSILTQLNLYYMDNSKTLLKAKGL